MSSNRKRPYQIRGFRWRFGTDKRTKTFSLEHNAMAEAQIWANETGREVRVIKGNLLVTTIQADKKHLAYQRGLEDVRMKYQYAPSNPYDPETQKEEHEQWDMGAWDAGIGEIYNNGVLIGRFR